MYNKVEGFKNIFFQCQISLVFSNRRRQKLHSQHLWNVKKCGKRRQEPNSYFHGNNLKRLRDSFQTLETINENEVTTKRKRLEFHQEPTEDIFPPNTPVLVPSQAQQHLPLLRNGTDVNISLYKNTCAFDAFMQGLISLRGNVPIVKFISTISSLFIDFILNITLGSIPINLDIFTEKYVLKSIVEFEDVDEGHFKSYILRTGWECFDDIKSLSSKIRNPLTKKINPVMAVYINKKFV